MSKRCPFLGAIAAVGLLVFGGSLTAEPPTPPSSVDGNAASVSTANAMVDTGAAQDGPVCLADISGCVTPSSAMGASTCSTCSACSLNGTLPDRKVTSGGSSPRALRTAPSTSSTFWKSWGSGSAGCAHRRSATRDRSRRTCPWTTGCHTFCAVGAMVLLVFGSPLTAQPPAPPADVGGSAGPHERGGQVPLGHLGLRQLASRRVRERVRPARPCSLNGTPPGRTLT